MNIEKRLVELGIILPIPVAPVANYLPFVVHGRLVYLSGQLPMANGALAYVGKVGQHLDIEQGAQAARLCAINLIAQIKAACGGDLQKVSRIVRLGGFVQCLDDFADQPRVINGASNLMVEVFGEIGKHARAAVGVNALPLNAAVEVDAIVAIDD